MQANDRKTAELLISKGADLNNRDVYGYTPLLWSLYYGYYDLAKALIEKGADVNAREKKLRLSPPVLKSAGVAEPVDASGR